MFFEKQVDLTDRKAMIRFLKEHVRYFTMNSWNRSTSYANNVKFYKLGLTEEQETSAYQFLDPDLDTSELQQAIQEQIFDFQETTGYTIGFNGRSQGYLVLYDTKYNLETKTMAMYPGRSIDRDADFEDAEEWPDELLAERVQLVCAFDRTCDQIRDVFLSYCIPDCIRTEEVVVQRKRLCRPEA